MGVNKFNCKISQIFNMLKYCLILILLRYTTALKECNKNKDMPPHLQIRERILCDYDKTIRPVKHNDATSLDIKFFVHEFDFHLHSGYLQVGAWFAMQWVDEHIHWDPEKYGNIEYILLGTDDIWTPDISIYNRGMYGESKIIQSKAECVASYFNKVFCVAQTSIHGMCTPDYWYYPFDVQNCTLQIGSWYHSGEEINLGDIEAIDDTRSGNPEWHLESLTYKKNPGNYKNFPNETYPSIDFVFVIRRNGAPRFVMWMVPILIITGMTILTLYLDPESSERIYIITVGIPANIMFMLNSYWEVPQSGSTIPYLLLVQRNCQLIMLFTLIETIFVRYLLNNTKDTPRYLINIFTYLASKKIGQLLLFSEINPENAVENLTADDSSNLVEITDRPKEWLLLGKVIDKIMFLGVCFTYFVMFIVYVHRP